MVTNDTIINEIIKLDIDNKFDVCAKTLLLLNLSIESFYKKQRQ